MTARLLLIAHAATPAMRAGRFPGAPADAVFDAIDLKSGHGQIAVTALRERLALSAQAGDAIVFASPAACARDTAAALGLAPRIETALADMDYGRWHGRRLADFTAEESPQLMQWQRDAQAAPHGGESFEAVLARVAAWMDGCPELTGTAVAAAVTHAPVIRAALIHALGAPPSSFARIEVAPLSVVELRRAAAGEWRWLATRS